MATTTITSLSSFNTEDSCYSNDICCNVPWPLSFVTNPFGLVTKERRPMSVADTSAQEQAQQQEDQVHADQTVPVEILLQVRVLAVVGGEGAGVGHHPGVIALQPSVETGEVRFRVVASFLVFHYLHVFIDFFTQLLFKNNF